MKHRIEKAVVLGAGTMGSRIAAHFANAGLPCILLDIVAPDLPADARAAESNKIVRAGLEAAKKAKPAAFFTPALAERVAIGNFEDDLARCAEADWIIEVVAENLEIKRKLLSRVAQYRKPGALVTTNTSGLPVHLIAEGMSEEFQQHWAGTHFFNPPRYLKLVEVIPGPHTLPEVIESLSDFCDRRLGKGVVIAKDTPNFIANRIGTFSMLHVVRRMGSLGIPVRRLDAGTGPGRRLKEGGRVWVGWSGRLWKGKREIRRRNFYGARSQKRVFMRRGVFRKFLTVLWMWIALCAGALAGSSVHSRSWTPSA